MNDKITLGVSNDAPKGLITKLLNFGIEFIEGTTNFEVSEKNATNLLFSGLDLILIAPESFKCSKVIDNTRIYKELVAQTNSVLVEAPVEIPKTLEELRTFFTENNVKFRHNAGLAKLWESFLEVRDELDQEKVNAFIGE